MLKCVYFHWLSNLSWRGNKRIRIFYVGWKQVGFKVLLPLSDARAVHFSQVRLEKEEWSAFCGMDVIFSDVLRWRWGGDTGGTRKRSAFTMVLQGCWLRDTHAWDYSTSLASELVWNLFLPPSPEPVPLAAACLLLHPQLLALGGWGGMLGTPFFSWVWKGCRGCPQSPRSWWEAVSRRAEVPFLGHIVVLLAVPASFGLSPWPGGVGMSVCTPGAPWRRSLR